MRFDPAIAYRILVEKQERLLSESSSLDWNAIYQRTLGNIDNTECQRLQHVSDTLRADAYKMFDVIDYLSERMEQES